MTFFHGSVFLADPDPDSEKKADPDPGKKNPDPKHWVTNPTAT